MNSSDQQNFFETDASQARRERKAHKSKNKLGNPIELLSKINAVVVDPAAPSSCIYTAGSTGSVLRLDVDAEEPKKATFRGPKGPATCVAVGGTGNSLLFAGSWDRSVWSWDVATRKPHRTYVGHSDFVKAVACATIGDRHVLISGGADKKIIVWDIESGARLHTLQDTVVPMLAVQDLVVDPATTAKNSEIQLLSASSDPHIRRWRIKLDSAQKVVESDPDTPGSARHSILEHETSVYKLVFDREGDEIDLWTSSADGTAKRLSRISNFAVDETYEHGDYVRAVALTDRWVITAGRDEDVKIWDRGTGKLHLALEGHFDEITDLVMLHAAGGTSGLPERVCSVSIDGTVRTWPLDGKGLEEARKRQEEAKGQGAKQEEVGKKEGVLTAEEDAELAELMGDDD